MSECLIWRCALGERRGWFELCCARGMDLKWTRVEDGPFSVLRLSVHDAAVEIRVRTWRSRRSRRAILLSFFRELKDVFRFWSGIYIHHDGMGLNPWEIETRPLNFWQLPEVRNPVQTLGFRIRMRRLELGLTQKQLSAKTGLTRTHISHIEHGHGRIRSETKRLLEGALQFKIRHSDICLGKGRGWDERGVVETNWQRQLKRRRQLKPRRGLAQKGLGIEPLIF